MCKPDFVIWQVFCQKNGIPPVVLLQPAAKWDSAIVKFTFARNLFQALLCSSVPYHLGVGQRVAKYRKNLFAKGKQWKSFWCALKIHHRHHHKGWHSVVASQLFTSIAGTREVSILTNRHHSLSENSKMIRIRTELELTIDLDAGFGREDHKVR